VTAPQPSPDRNAYAVVDCRLCGTTSWIPAEARNTTCGECGCTVRRYDAEPAEPDLTAAHAWALRLAAIVLSDPGQSRDDLLAATTTYLLNEPQLLTDTLSCVLADWAHTLTDLYGTRHAATAVISKQLNELTGSTT
jgi:hypothetical protein